MGIFDRIKNRLSNNFKSTQLMYMTQPAQIVAFCKNLTPAEREGVRKAIESAFKWQPVAQIAQAIFPMLTAPRHGVSAEAMDLINGGFISGGVDLMAMQNQRPASPQFGITGQQQASLSFAWWVLQQFDSAGQTGRSG
jgi:hypothetical protein